MFSALKRHFKSGQESEQPSIKTSPIPASLQAKFKRGIDANMKIIICGKRKSGKSSLLNRLKGRPHEALYAPTTEVVQVILWKFLWFFQVQVGWICRLSKFVNFRKFSIGRNTSISRNSSTYRNSSIFFKINIQAVTVNWNYKSTSDVAKVDAWEIQGTLKIIAYKKSDLRIFQIFFFNIF